MKRCESRGTVWLVRHGESTWNASGLVQGQSDESILTPEGRTQALDAATVLVDQGIGSVVASDLLRTRETAAIIGAELGLNVLEDTALRERHFGVAQGMPFSALGPDWSGVDDGRVVDVHARPPGGESLTDLTARVRSFLHLCLSQSRESDVLMVTHGGVIRVAQAAVRGVPMDGMAWGAVPNASIWALDPLSESISELRQQQLLERGG